MRLKKNEKEVLNMNVLFSSLIAIWCEKFKKTQADLARILAVNPQSISQWKTGTNNRRAPWSVIRVLLQATGTSIILSENSVDVIHNDKIKIKGKKRK